MNFKLKKLCENTVILTLNVSSVSYLFILFDDLLVKAGVQIAHTNPSTNCTHNYWKKRVENLVNLNQKTEFFRFFSIGIACA